MSAKVRHADAVTTVSRSRLRYAALLTSELVATAFLVLLGRSARFAVPAGDLSGWLELTPAADAVAVLVRLVALGVCGWLTATTLLAFVVRVGRSGPLVRVVDLVTLPFVRRIAQRAAAVAMAGSLVLPGAALAATGAPIGAPSFTTQPAGVDDATALVGPGPPGWSAVTPVRQGDPSPAPLPTPAASPGAPAAPGPPSAPAPPAPGPPAAPVEPVAAAVPSAAAGQPVADRAAVPAETYVVVAGDSFWVIAARRVAAQRGVDVGELTAAQVHDHWSSLVAANLDSLASGDPDLIHPGEVLVVPPLPPVV